MRSCGRVFAAAACSLLASVADADAVFNIWVEAPAQVLAGETFTASVWGEISGSILNKSDGGMSGVSTDMLASGLNTQFSTATIPFMATLNAGTPEPNALRGVLGASFPTFPQFDPRNPLRLFDVQVTTESGAAGELQITVAPARDLNVDYMLGWWVNYGTGDDVVDTDPGSSRIITPATVNVIPTPASLALLALAGAGAVRRRRR